MTQPIALSNRPQLALQSYLDDLLFDATQAALVESDEFADAILEEQVRDASRAGQTPSQFDDKTRGVIAYRALLKHVLTRQLAPQVA